MKTQNTSPNMTILECTKIVPSDFNPRKTFIDADTQELCESIKKQGVLQPIMVRPKDGKFEIVYGERRYRAAILAGLKKLPVIIRELTDIQAREIAITENLQRKDVAPIEEAQAYEYLLNNSKYDIAQLVQKFGKSDSFIRNRLRLNDLIPEFVTLLEKDELKINVANEVCKYDVQIQRDAYEKHFKDDNGWSSWRNLKVNKVIDNFEQTYTDLLEVYHFDKTECINCKYNSKNYSLFNHLDGEGSCSLKSCLQQKNTDYVIQQVIEVGKQYPTAALCKTYRTNDNVIAKLELLGYEVEELTNAHWEFEEPQTPNKEEYAVEEEYKNALDEYNENLLEYREIEQQIVTGDASLFIGVGNKDVSLYYVKNKDLAKIVNDKSPVTKLEAQDKRNKEIVHEKTIEDAKKIIREAKLISEFSDLEEKITYFGMLSSLSREHFSALGLESIPYYLSEQDKLYVIDNLTDEIKNLIRRDFIIEALNGATGTNLTSDLLLKFVRQHLIKDLETIESRYNEVYEKRHERITEKLVALQNEKEC